MSGSFGGGDEQANTMSRSMVQLLLSESGDSSTIEESVAENETFQPNDTEIMERVDEAVELEEVEEEEAVEEIFSWRTITTAVNTLAMPSIAYGVSRLLTLSPQFRRAVPDHFHQCVIGGCAFVVATDAARLIWALHMRQSIEGMRILEP